MCQTVEIAHAKIPREELEAERHSVRPEDIMEGGSEFRINAGHVSRTQLLLSVLFTLPRDLHFLLREWKLPKIKIKNKSHYRNSQILVLCISKIILAPEN